MPEVLAIRPDDQSFALLLHLVGATVVFGALLASATSLLLARGDTRLLRLGYFSLLFVGLPGLILLRVAGQWLYQLQNWAGSEPIIRTHLAQHRIHRRRLGRDPLLAGAGAWRGRRLPPTHRQGKTVGTFPWKAQYPRGMEDLKAIVAKVKAAGLIPGLHILYTMATSSDPVVTPVPDRRLNLIQKFTLSEPVDAQSTSLAVDENPHLCPTNVNAQGLDPHGRLLQIQNEIVSYTSYTTHVNCATVWSQFSSRQAETSWTTE